MRTPVDIVMAFDFGVSKIGIAIGQTLTRGAQPLQTIPAKDGIPDWQQIEKLLAEWKPQLLVVGLPLNMDDSESELAQRARKFANRLHGRFGLPVELFDERLSSREAREFVASEEGRLAAQSGLDAVAAGLILESWFNHRGSS